MQRLTHRRESSEPTSGSHSWGIWPWEEEPREHLALRTSGACAQELHRTGGNRDPILKRRTWTFTCTGSQGRASSPEESGSNLTAVLGGHPGKTGVNVACYEGWTLKAKLSGIFSSCLSLEVAIWGKSGPTHQSVLRSPRANNNPGEITAPPLSKQAT